MTSVRSRRSASPIPASRGAARVRTRMPGASSARACRCRGHLEPPYVGVAEQRAAAQVGLRDEVRIAEQELPDPRHSEQPGNLVSQRANADHCGAGAGQGALLPAGNQLRASRSARPPSALGCRWPGARRPAGWSSPIARDAHVHRALEDPAAQPPVLETRLGVRRVLVNGQRAALRIIRVADAGQHEFIRPERIGAHEAARSPVPVTNGVPDLQQRIAWMQSPGVLGQRRVLSVNGLEELAADRRLASPGVQIPPAPRDQPVIMMHPSDLAVRARR